jgi:hypothetical protein
MRQAAGMTAPIYKHQKQTLPSGLAWLLRPHRAERVSLLGCGTGWDVFDEESGNGLWFSQ